MGTDAPPRLRVLIGTDTFPPDINGAARFTRDLAVQLSRRGHTVHVVAPATSISSDTRVEMFEGERIIVHRLRSLRWPLHEWLRVAPPWEARHTVGHILDTTRPDVIHVQSVINIGHALSFEAHRRGIPLVATNHLMPENAIEFSGMPRRLHPVLTRVGWRYLSHALEQAQVVTSPTPRAAGYLERNTAVGTVLPISCGIDLGRFRFDEDRPAGNRVLYVGRLDPEKSLDTLLEAFALLRPELDAHLDIVGGGAQLHQLEHLAGRLGIAARTTFHGRVDDRRLVELHESATVFVMPSTAELQSIASLEAMACGTPLVLADAMALPHLVSPGGNGYLVSPHRPAAFAHAIDEVLTLPPERYRAMRVQSRLRVLEHDQARVTSQFEQLYSAVREPLRRERTARAPGPPGRRGHP